MKQKIVIKIQTECEKCRKKAMMVAAQTSGVNSVELLQAAGESKKQMVVIGEGIDVAALARSVRKKIKNASLETVQQL